MANRYICSALDEMRDAIKTLNVFTLYRYKKFVPSLIEEIQVLANRMESALGDGWECNRKREELDELKVKVRALKSEVKTLEAKKLWLTGDTKDE